MTLHDQLGGDTTPLWLLWTFAGAAWVVYITVVLVQSHRNRGRS